MYTFHESEDHIMILNIQKISKTFPGNEVLRGVSFHIEENEKAALVGINGAGKSTLLKIIVGEMQADDGTVILSKDRTLGYLAQHQDLTGDATVYGEFREKDGTPDRRGPRERDGILCKNPGSLRASERLRI